MTIDYIIVPLGWLIGNIVFNNFEKHQSFYRRIFKFVLIVIIIYGIGLFFGRIPLYAVMGLLVFGIVLLHGWWFPKNGVNGFTAEPYDRYLRLIKKRKKVKIRY